MKVAGLDVSLTSSGWAVVDTDDVWPLYTGRVTSKRAPLQTGFKMPTLLERHTRMRDIEDGLLLAVGRCRPGTRGISRLPDLAVVEGPAMAAAQGADDMGGNRWRIIAALFDLGVPVVEVSPSSVKLYATGSGSVRGETKVTKPMVIAAVQATYGDIGASVKQNDEADALILAAMGARHLGHIIESAALSPAHLRAMTKVRWPEGITA